MAFPVSISGRIAIPMAELLSRSAPVERLRAALAGETVENLRRQGDVLSFRHRRGFHSPIARPGGNWWMFDGFDSGRFEFSENAATLTIRYRLRTAKAFALVSAVAIAAGLAIQSSSGPQHEWGWCFGVSLWLVMFGSTYASRAIEIPHWLRTVMTADVLPAPRELRVPSVD